MTEKRTDIPSPLRLWAEEALPGWLLPVALIAVVVVVGGLYLFDVLSDHLTGLLLALAVGVGTTAAVWRSLASHCTAVLERVLAHIAVLLMLVACLAPALATLNLGEPVASGALTTPGEALALPTEAVGPVRVWVRGGLAGTGDVRLNYELQAGDQNVTGKLERTTNTVRAGRRGNAKVSHDYTSELVSTTVPDGASSLVLSQVDGPLVGALKLAVYHDRWPVGLGVGLAVVVLLGIAALAARMQTEVAPVTMAGLGLAFGAMVYRFVTPDVSVRSEIGALIVGAIGGVTLGALAHVVMKRVIPIRPGARPIPKAARAR